MSLNGNDSEIACTFVPPNPNDDTAANKGILGGSTLVMVLTNGGMSSQVLRTNSKISFVRQF